MYVSRVVVIVVVAPQTKNVLQKKNGLTFCSTMQLLAITDKFLFVCCGLSVKGQSTASVRRRHLSNLHLVGVVLNTHLHSYIYT